MTKIKNINMGVISDLNHTSSPAYSSYYYACLNIFENVKLINDINDLENIDVILCGNDHHVGHLNVWSNDLFINYCNTHNIPFFVHTVEHIRTPAFPWNLEIQSKLEKYNLLNQRCWDINDCEEKNTNIARVLLSKDFLKYREPIEKKDKIIFIGKLYNNRIELINALSKHIEIEVVERGNNDYFEFLSKLAEYKYILSPKSLFVNGIPGRFYESLWVNSIPLQEIYDNTLDYYNIERDNSNAIFFKTPEELIFKLQMFSPNLNLNETHKMFLEDELIDFFKEFNLIK
jgi:hypothetical protein